MAKKIPDVIECANCQRTLDPKVYRIPLNENVPEERIKRIVAPTYPYFSVLCPNCGYYSVFTPHEEK